MLTARRTLCIPFGTQSRPAEPCSVILRYNEYMDEHEQTGRGIRGNSSNQSSSNWSRRWFAIKLFPKANHNCATAGIAVRTLMFSTRPRYSIWCVTSSASNLCGHFSALGLMHLQSQIAKIEVTATNFSDQDQQQYTAETLAG